MSLDRTDSSQFKILDTKLEAIDSEEQIDEFILFIKHHQFDGDIIRLGSAYRHFSILSMALKHGFEALIQRLMTDQFSIEPNDRIYNIETLIKYFHLYNDFNQNHALEAMINKIWNEELGYSSETTLKRFDDLKNMFDLNHIAVKDIKVNDRLFSFILDFVDKVGIHLKETTFLMNLIEQAIQDNVLPKNKTTLKILKDFGLIDLYDDCTKKQLLVAELLSDGEELILSDVISCDIDAGINII